MYDKATRLKLRFDSPPGLVPQGQLSVEDLWDLPLTSVKRVNLDDIAVLLNKELKATDSVSFVNNTSRANEVTKLKFDIVLDVIRVKKEENEAEQAKRTNAEKKQKILALIDQKRDGELASKSVEELLALAKDL
jgi:hypothetical protein